MYFNMSIKLFLDIFFFGLLVKLITVFESAGREGREEGEKEKGEKEKERGAERRGDGEDKERERER